MTYEAAIFGVCAAHPWAAAWFRLGCVVVKAGGRRWQAKDVDAQCPSNVETLGCSGLTLTRQVYDWIGWDLDCKANGSGGYTTTDAAIADARRLRKKLNGCAEIRLSKSGSGVHIRHLLEYPVKPDAAKAMAVALARGVWLHSDPAALGRQCFDLWARSPGPRGFELIEPHGGNAP